VNATAIVTWVTTFVLNCVLAVLLLADLVSSTLLWWYAILSVLAAIVGSVFQLVKHARSDGE
jgi:hypothetical protein